MTGKFFRSDRKIFPVSAYCCHNHRMSQKVVNQPQAAIYPDSHRPDDLALLHSADVVPDAAYRDIDLFGQPLLTGPGVVFAPCGQYQAFKHFPLSRHQTELVEPFTNSDLSITY